MKRPPNYSFFRKLWIFESGLKPEITPDADKILYEFWAKQEEGAVALMDTRFLRDIYKIAEAEAKLNLSEEVTEQIADETQQAIMIMLVQYGEEIKKIVLPSEITYNVCLEIIKYTKVGISVDELMGLAKREEVQVSSYLGNMSMMQDSKKIQKLVSKLIRHPNIKVINERPKVLQWTDEVGLSGAYGAYDAEKKASSESIEN